MIQGVSSLTKNKFAPLFLLGLFLGQFSMAFMLGAGIDRYSADGSIPFWIGGIGSLVFLFLALLFVPFFAGNAKSYKIKRIGYISFIAVFVCAVCLSLCLTFAVFRPFEYAFPKSWASLPGWGPLIAVLISVFVDCLFFYAGYKTRNLSAMPLVQENSITSPLQNALVKFAPVFFLSYFILILAPYYTAQIPIVGEFLVIGYQKIAYRLLTTIYLLGYSVVVAFAFKKPLCLSWAFPLFTSLTTYLLAWLFLPNGYAYIAVGKMGSVSIATNTVGFESMIISFGLYAIEIAIFLCAVSWLPCVVRSRKTIIWTFAFFISFMVFACAFSLFYERDLYIKALSGDGGKTIASLFHHKNEFGAMLFLGSFSSIFLFHYLKTKWRYLCLAGTIVFLAFSVFVRCYTGLVPILIMGFAVLVFDLSSLFKKHKPVFFCVLLGATSIIAIFCIMTFVESARNAIPFFASIYKNLEAAEHEIQSRTDVWNAASHLITGTSVFIGKTDPIANRELIAYLDMFSITNLNDYHSAFVSFYTNHGIVGLFVYVLIIVWVYHRCIAFIKVDKRFAVLLVILLSSAVLFSMPESYTLFINMSGLAFPTLMLFIIFLPFLYREKGGQL